MGYVLVVLFFLLYYFGIITIPIVIGFKINIEIAIATYLGLLLTTTLPRYYIALTKENYDVNHTILVSLMGLFKFQMIIVVLFGFNFSLSSIVNNIYNSSYYLSNTLSIMTTILFFNTILITLYLYWKDIIANSKQLNFKNEKPRSSSTLLIIVTSSIVGIIALFEMNLNTQDNIAYNKILELILIILVAIIIPSLFSFLTREIIKLN